MTPWLLLAAAPLLAAVGWVCLREPLRIALPLYTALIPFGGAISLGSTPFSSASSLVGLVLGAGLVLRLATANRSAPRLPASVPLWLLFLALAAATSLWTIDDHATVTGLAVLTSLVVVFVLVALSDVDRTVVRRTESALLAGATGAVAWGAFQLAFLGGLAADTGGTVAEGGRFGNGLLGPNILAVTLLIPLAIALNRAFNPQDPGRPFPHAVLAGVALAGVLMTGSRTGVLGAAAVAVVMLVAIPRGGRRGLAVSLVVGAVLTTLVWTLHPFGLAERTFESATSSSGRLDIWRVGIAACADYCVPGSGWGTFPEVYAQTQASVAGARVLTGDEGSYQPHNLWLLVVIELGVAGLVLFTMGLLASAAEALRLPAAYRPPALGALVGLALGVLFLSSMEFKMFWLVLILVAIYRNASLAERTDDAPHRDPVP